MTERLKTPINLEFLKPKPGLGLLIQALGHYSEFTGFSKQEIINAVRGRQGHQEGSPFFSGLLKRINFIRKESDLDHLGELLTKIYGFEGSGLAFHSFLDAQKSSRDLILFLIKTYGLDLDRFDLKNEVLIPDPDIRRILAYLNPRPNSIIKNGTSERSRFEQWRELFLVDLFLRSNCFGQKEEWAKIISSLQQRFNNELFVGQAGSGRIITFYLRLNEDNGIIDVSKTKRRGLKEKDLEMRAIEMFNNKRQRQKINVEVNFSIKSGVSKILKLLNNFYRKGIYQLSPFSLDSDGKEALQDRLRFSLVVDSNDENVFRGLIEKVGGFFDSYQGKPSNYDYGQNPTFRHRIIGRINGLPIEILFYDIKGYLNSQYHIGRLLETKIKVKVNSHEKEVVFKLHNGQAHQLYELRRGLSLIFLMFPYEIYAKRDKTGKVIETEDQYIKSIVEAVESRDQQIVNQLRGL